MPLEYRDGIEHYSAATLELVAVDATDPHPPQHYLLFLSLFIDELVWNHTEKTTRLMSSAMRELITNTLILAEAWINVTIGASRPQELPVTELCRILRGVWARQFNLRTRQGNDDPRSLFEDRSLIGQEYEVLVARKEMNDYLLKAEYCHLPCR